MCLKSIQFLSGIWNNQPCLKLLNCRPAEKTTNSFFLHSSWWRFRNLRGQAAYMPMPMPMLMSMPMPMSMPTAGPPLAADDAGPRTGFLKSAQRAGIPKNLSPQVDEFLFWAEVREKLGVCFVFILYLFIYCLLCLCESYGLIFFR